MKCIKRSNKWNINQRVNDLWGINSHLIRLPPLLKADSQHEWEGRCKHHYVETRKDHRTSDLFSGGAYWKLISSLRLRTCHIIQGSWDTPEKLMWWTHKIERREARDNSVSTIEKRRTNYWPQVHDCSQLLRVNHSRSFLWLLIHSSPQTPKKQMTRWA